jgi:REP element-mobilizing transposase RayT
LILLYPRDKTPSSVSLKPKSNNNKSGGTGFQPVHTFQVSRRNLPHWQQPGKTYFITWRVKDGAILRDQDRGEVLKALRYWDGSKWTLLVAVIMPDHVHVLAQPLPRSDGGVFDLGEILHSVKRHSARIINQFRGTQGSIWQDKRFDRIVRDEEEFMEKWNYIRNNPVELGLADRPEEYSWLYEVGIESTG